jgi:hypothetical protein
MRRDCGVKAKRWLVVQTEGINPPESYVSLSARGDSQPRVRATARGKCLLFDVVLAVDEVRTIDIPGRSTRGTFQIKEALLIATPICSQAQQQQQ